MFNFIHQLRGLLLITLLCFITACGSGGDDPYVVTDVNLSAESTSIPMGLTQLIEGEARYSNGDINDASSGNSMWTSEDENIATVDNNGVVTGINEGTTNINARYLGGDGTMTGSILINITEAVLVEIEIIPSAKDVPIGLHIKYEAIGTYSDKTEHLLDNNSDIIWGSSKTTFATIDSDSAIAETLAVGETIISVEFESLGSTSVLNVTEESLVRLTISPEKEGEISIPDGYTVKFTAEATYTGDSKVIVTNDVTWHSSDYLNLNPSVPNGTFEGIEPSEEEVTATLGLKTSNAILVKVTDANLESVVIEPQEDPYPIGLTKNLIATGSFSGGSEKNIAKEASVKWESLNPEVATVDNDGLLTSISIGTATIRVTTQDNGISDTENFEITDAKLTATIVITPKDLLLAPGESRQYIATGLYTDGNEHIINEKPGIYWSLSDDVDNNYNNGVSINSRGIISNYTDNTRVITKQLTVNVHVEGYSNSDQTYTNVAAVKVLGESDDVSYVGPFSVTDAVLLGLTSSTYQSLSEDGYSGPKDVEFIRLTQTSATTECTNLVYNTHDDYRLPTTAELMSLWTTYDGKNDDDYQLYTKEKWSVGEYFWTSEPSGIEGTFKIVDLRDGLDSEVSDNTVERYFSCVRDNVSP
jgi:uncharacterized protein YjdB